MSASPYSRRAFLSALGVAGAAAATAGVADLVGGTAAQAATAGPSSYTASWSSVDQHPAAPEWFQDAKFGIYFHWGAFSVPAFANEWYPRNMYISGSAQNNHHIATYGDPSVWPYHNFINGARDKAGNCVQFAPKLKSAGGNFDPDEWAQLFVDAGAKFAGPVAEHHDGFSMWNSTVNEWNSVTTGPELDLLGLHADAIRGQGPQAAGGDAPRVQLHRLLRPRAGTVRPPACKKLYGQLGTRRGEPAVVRQAQGGHRRLPARHHLAGLQPDPVHESQRLNFLSYYYNQAVAWDKDVVATYKDGFNNNGEVFDYRARRPGRHHRPRTG